MNRPMSCSNPDLHADLKAYLDSELPFLRRRAITQHLQRCESCRQEIQEMEKITRDLKTANPAAVLQTDLRQKLLSRIPTEPAVPTARVLPLWRRQPALVFGSGVICAALFLSVFVPLFSQMRKETYSASAPASSSANAPAYLSNEKQTGLATLQYAQEYDQKAYSPQANLDNRREIASVSTEDALRFQPQGASDAKEANVPAFTFKAPTRLRTITRDPEVAGESIVADEGRQVHKEGSISLAVAKLEESSDKVEEMVKASGGYVASNDLSTDDSGYKSASLTVRIPVAQFEDMMKQFARLGDVTAKSISGEDITEKMSDANQATTVLADEVESSSAKLRSFDGSDKERRYREADLRQTKIRLAQEKARLGLLRKMATLATIGVSLTEKGKKTAVAAPPQTGFLADLHETNKSASAAFQAAIRVPVVLVIWVLAFSPLWVPLVILYRYAAIKSLARQAAATVSGVGNTESKIIQPDS